MPGQNYVVTDAHGGRQLFANVANAASFLEAIASSGKVAAQATTADLLEAGVLDEKGQEIKSFASFRVANLGRRSAPTAHGAAPVKPMRKDTSALADAVARTNARSSIVDRREKEAPQLTDKAAATASAPAKKSLRAVMDSILGKAR